MTTNGIVSNEWLDNIVTASRFAALCNSAIAALETFVGQICDDERPDYDDQLCSLLSQWGAHRRVQALSDRYLTLWRQLGDTRRLALDVSSLITRFSSLHIVADEQLLLAREVVGDKK